MIERIDWESIPRNDSSTESCSCGAEQFEHLLKVAQGVSQDANRAWADVWAQLKHLVTHSGTVLPKAKEGFVPACGWPEFFERLWKLKHYIDCVHRICGERPQRS